MGFDYEPYKIKYTQPQQERTYLPDFAKDKVILETKGIFSSSDRKKMLLLREQHPDKIFVMVFGQAQNRLSKKSNTTYAMWCQKNNFPWFDLADFEKDPKKCLSTLTPKNKLGNSRTPLQKKKSPSLKSLKK